MNVANGTTLYWTIESVSGTVNANDFEGGLTGSFTINNNAGSFTIVPKRDVIKENQEAFRIRIRTTSTSGTVVATSSDLIINDTSFSQVFNVTSSVRIFKGDQEVTTAYSDDEEIYKP